MLIVTTPIHEAAHWIMSDIDPFIQPVEFHLFDESSINRGQNILSSALGYVVVEEAYPRAFDDRLKLADLLQEFICILIQIIITCYMVSKILTIMADNNFKLNKKLNS